MLKAVRFEETEHQHFIKFINEYRNNKNKPNDSEAIRYLMQLGYDSLSAPPSDLESIKSDIIKNVVEALSNKIPDQPIIDIENIKKDIAKDLNKKRKTPPVINIDALKKELMEELKKEISSSSQPVQSNQSDALTLLLAKLIDKMDSSPQVIVQPQLVSSNVELIKEKSVRAIKESTVEIPSDTNSLLANILGNANK